MDLDLDFSLETMFAPPDDPLPRIVVTVPVVDGAGTHFASVHDAARFYRTSRASINRSLRDGIKVRGMNFLFP